MGEFVCRVADADGRVFSHVEAAGSVAEARQKLADRGLFVFSVNPRSSLISGLFQKASTREVRGSDFLILNQQFNTLIKAGLPILRALDLLAERAASARLGPGGQVALRSGKRSGGFLEGLLDGDSGGGKERQPSGRARALYRVSEGEYGRPEADSGDAGLSDAAGDCRNWRGDLSRDGSDSEVRPAVQGYERAAAHADASADRAYGGLPVLVVGGVRGDFAYDPGNLDLLSIRRRRSGVRPAEIPYSGGGRNLSEVRGRTILPDTGDAAFGGHSARRGPADSRRGDREQIDSRFS